MGGGQPPGNVPPAMPTQPGADPYGTSPPAQQNNGMAIAALVCGILSLLAFWACFVGILLGILAVVFGFLGRSKAREMNGNGAGMALAGLITGGLGLLVSLVAFVAFFIIAESTDDFEGINSDPSDGECDFDRFLQDPDC